MEVKVSIIDESRLDTLETKIDMIIDLLNQKNKVSLDHE